MFCRGDFLRNKLIAVILSATMALSLTACDDSVAENADTGKYKASMFERHELDDYGYSILVDKETRVCYLEFDSGFYCYGITVMLNPDGTPKIWEED